MALRAAAGLTWGAILLATPACGDSAAPVASGAASAAASAPLPPWLGIPRSQAEVEKVINSSGRTPYAGKVGTLRGKVTIRGDEFPSAEWSFPADCPNAQAMYGRTFRKSPGGGIADALVSVTGYDAFVPPKAPVVPVKVQGCAFDQRLYAATFGQRLEIQNLDHLGSYTPFLDGASYRSVMVALPQGAPIKLYPTQPALNYVLRDFQAKPFLQARVLVLKFPTHDVTDGEGQYVIEGIPVGAVDVNVVLPGLIKGTPDESISVTIAEGENVRDVELVYDASKDKLEKPATGPFERKAAADGAGASTSASPSASTAASASAVATPSGAASTGAPAAGRTPTAQPRPH